MKINNSRIVLDEPFYLAGGVVTGKLIIKTSESKLGKTARVFMKFYDKLDIQWIEDELVSVGITKRAYTNFLKPFQLNIEENFDSKDAELVDNDDDDDYKFVYRFKFQLPEKLQGTVDVADASCKYFIKSYFTTDEDIAKHYQQNANVFDEFFKSLNHTYYKQEVVIHNPIYNIVDLNDGKHVFEAKSNHIKVEVTLPTVVFAKGSTIPITIVIEPNSVDNKSKLELHKMSFKLFQVLKLHAVLPRDKSRLFEELLAHSSRKRLRENFPNKIVVEEFIEIPKEIANSTSRTVIDENTDPGQSLIKHLPKNQIRINYKICLEFWRNFLVDDLDLNIPILIDPEI